MRDESVGLNASRGENIFVSMTFEGAATGHPAIRRRITLYPGIKNIYFETSVLKDATPLLNAHLGFCFKVYKPSVRYESALSVIKPPLFNNNSGTNFSVSQCGAAVLNLKRAHDGNGFIVRLWNFGDRGEDARIALKPLHIKSAVLVNPAEQDLGAACYVADGEVTVTVEEGEIVNVRICIA